MENTRVTLDSMNGLFLYYTIRGSIILICAYLEDVYGMRLFHVHFKLYWYYNAENASM